MWVANQEISLSTRQSMAQQEPGTKSACSLLRIFQVRYPCFVHLITVRSNCPFHHLFLLVKWVIVCSSCILVMPYLVAGAGLLNFIYLQSVL